MPTNSSNFKYLILISHIMDSSNEEHIGIIHIISAIPKECVPLDTYHVDFSRPLSTTHKKYQLILIIVDEFSKFP